MWICNCGIINAGNSVNCAAIRSPNLTFVKNSEHYQISNVKPDLITYAKLVIEIENELIISKQENQMPEREMTAEEKRYKELYNHERIFVSAMTYEELEEHINQLKGIALDAKIVLQASSDEKRDRDAKKSVKNKQWLLTDDKADINVTEAINKVKVRQDRMSKMDRLKKNLEDSGIFDDGDIKDIINKAKRKKDSELNSITFKTNKVVETTIQVIPVERKKFDASIFKKKINPESSTNEAVLNEEKQ